MNAIERCERYRDGEPVACADRLFSDGLVCGPCANLLTPYRSPTYNSAGRQASPNQSGAA